MSGLDQAEAPGWKVYLLRCADGTLYCGSTVDLERRLAQHNGEAPGGARYTRSRRPCELACFAPCPDRSSAMKLEAQIKRLARKDKIAALEGRLTLL
ncbi:MAG: GIY-YIG nuclease family protein [Desulfovibrio sp.]|nr:GIY-YIG nuclease family protein [Desulfovibrio sp.]